MRPVDFCGFDCCIATGKTLLHIGKVLHMEMASTEQTVLLYIGETPGRSGSKLSL